MNKNLDLKQSVHDLVTACPELADLLAGLGFSEIKNKALLETAGRMMTLPKGAALRKIDLDHVIQVLQENGFKIINRPEESSIDLRNQTGFRKMKSISIPKPKKKIRELRCLKTI